MIAIFKREVKNYLKRPLFWIGIALVIYGVFDATSPYLTTHYLAPGEKIVNDYPDSIHSGDVYEGYIPASPKKHRELYWLIMAMSAKDKRVRDDAAVLFTDPLKKMLEDFHLKEEESIHYRRLFRAIVHGFVSQEEQGFFSHYSAAVDDSFHFAVQCYIESLKQGEKRCSYHGKRKKE